MFNNETINTNETGDVSLKELCEQRGWIMARIVDNLKEEYPDDKISTTLNILLKNTDELIQRFKL